MKVIGDQCPCIADGLRILENASQALQKIIPVGIVPEYRAPFNAPDHDMVEGASSIDSRSSGHLPSLPFQTLPREPKNLPAFTHKLHVTWS
jgi:hypothetical protein